MGHNLPGAEGNFNLVIQILILPFVTYNQNTCSIWEGRCFKGGREEASSDIMTLYQVKIVNASENYSTKYYPDPASAVELLM